jgi:acetolactate synthase-1/2/3 large subunit
LTFLPFQNSSGARYFLEWLKIKDIRSVFLVPGSQIVSLLNELSQTPEITPIVANHELAAGYMADGYARVTEHAGVCLATSGPGASNLLTAAVTARMDGSGVLFVTGNVAVAKQGTGAFQDAGNECCRDVELFAAAVNTTMAVNSVDELAKILDSTWQSMCYPCPSPAHLSIANDVFEDSLTSLVQTSEVTHSHRCPPDLHSVIDALNSAERTVLWVGKGLNNPETTALLQRFAEIYKVPVVTTLDAKGLLSERHPLSFGNAGFGGQERANALLQDAEIQLLLLLGVELNEKNSEGWDAQLAASTRTIVRIDAVATPERYPVQPDLEVIADSLEVLRYLVDTSNERSLTMLQQTANSRTQWLHKFQQQDSRTGLLERLITSLQHHAKEDAILVVDAGSHRPVAGRLWVAEPKSFFNPSATAPMGWGICAAIGMQLAKPKSRVICLTGDGCMRMHGIELATAARYSIPVLFVVCNNAAYASTGKLTSASASGMINLPELDWVGFAKTLGVSGLRVNNSQDLTSAILWAFAHREEPCLLEVITPSC